MTSSHRNALQPGHRVHWYEIEAILGQGGFGITYLASDTNLARKVAIKEYLPVELAVRERDATVHPVSSEQATLRVDTGFASAPRPAGIAAGRLTEPPYDNALDRARALREAAPGDARAEAIEKRIADALVLRAERALRVGDSSLAADLHRQARRLHPNAPSVQEMTTRLREAGQGTAP